MNTSALLSFIREVLLEAYVPSWSVSPEGTFSAKLELTDDEVGVGSVLGKERPGEHSTIVRYPFSTTIRLNYGDEKKPYEFDVISSFGGSWYKGKDADETKAYRQQYTKQMGEIKALARFLKETDDPIFKKLLEEASQFIARKFERANLSYIIIPQSSSPLAHQFATILAAKMGAKIVNSQEMKDSIKKDSETLDIDLSQIEKELENKYNKNYRGKYSLKPPLTHDEWMADSEHGKEYVEEYNKYFEDAYKSLESTRRAGQRLGSPDPKSLQAALAAHYGEQPQAAPYRIQGTGGRGNRRYLKGGIQIPNVEKYRGKGVLVVDDNVAEGWTIKEIARILLENGASEVRGATLWKWGSESSIPPPKNAPSPIQKKDEDGEKVEKKKSKKQREAEEAKARAEELERAAREEAKKKINDASEEMKRKGKTPGREFYSWYSYNVGDVILHNTYGLGVIVSFTPRGSAEALFEDGKTRILLLNK